MLSRYLLVLLTLFFAKHVLALTCVPKEPADIVGAAEIAFIGKVVKSDISEYASSPICWKTSANRPRCGGKVATLEISRTLRGEAKGQITVLAEDACYCAATYFDVGEEYLVIAKRNQTSFPAALLAEDICSGTGPASGKRQQLIIEKFTH